MARLVFNHRLVCPTSHGSVDEVASPERLERAILDFGAKFRMDVRIATQMCTKRLLKIFLKRNIIIVVFNRENYHY